MPLTEVEPSSNDRRRTLHRVQAPFVVMTLIVSIAALVAVPHAFFTAPYLSGLALIVATAVTGAVLPWDRLPYSWMMLLAIVDLLAVSLLRFAMYDALPAIGILAVFPAIWLAYAFHGRLMSIAVWASILLVALPLVILGPTPETPRAWVNVMILPVGLVLIVSAVRAAAIQVRRNRAALDRISALQIAAMRSAQDSELVMRSVFDTVDAAMAFYGVDNRPVVANEAARATVANLGFSLDYPPFAGVDVYRADRTTQIPFDQQIIPRALRGERIANHVEWLGPPGDQTAIMASAQQVHRPDGGLLGTVIAVFDITELANAVEIREEFLRTVSHELRTPLTSIIGYLEVMEDSTDLEAAGIAEYMEVVRRNAAELHTRVGQLLSFTDEVQTSRRELTDVSVSLTEAILAHQPAAELAGLALTSDIAPGIVFNADMEQAHAVLDHLISNAIKYTAPGGSVVVQLRRERAHLAFTVSDTGRGMTPDQQRRAFDRFYRASDVRNEAVQGFGIGLSIVKDIVEAHDGSIEMDSTPDVGTSVTIRLPNPTRSTTPVAR